MNKLLYLSFIFCFLGCSPKENYDCRGKGNFDTMAPDILIYHRTISNDSALGFTNLLARSTPEMIRINFSTDCKQTMGSSDKAVTVEFDLRVDNNTFDIYTIDLAGIYYVNFDSNLGINHYKQNVVSSQLANEFRILLTENDFFNLPDHSEIKNFPYKAYEFTVFQIKTPCYYKFISYPSIIEAERRVSEAHRFNNVVKFIKNMVNNSPAICGVPNKK